MGMEDMFGEALLIVKDFSTIFAFNLVINLVWFQFYVLTITIIVTYKLLSNCSVLYHCKVFVTEDFSNPIQNIHELLCFRNCDPWEDDDIVTSSLTQPRPPLLVTAEVEKRPVD